MNVEMRISAIVLAAAVVVCAALLLAWRPWGVDGDAGGGARAATQGKAEVASADASQQVSEAPAKNVADAALTEEGFAALFPEGVEVINPGPSRDEFASDEEWEHYWEHFHEVEVGLSYGAVPVVKDAEGRQHIPGEIILYANEQMTDEAIVSVVESRGLHVANLNRMDGADVVATVYSDNIAADLDELCERFDDAENVTVEIDRSTGNWLDDDLAADAKSNRQHPARLHPRGHPQVARDEAARLLWHLRERPENAEASCHRQGELEEKKGGWEHNFEAEAQCELLSVHNYRNHVGRKGLFLR